MHAAIVSVFEVLFEVVIHCGALKITHPRLNKNECPSDYYLKEHRA